jgi:hypothetical protein
MEVLYLGYDWNVLIPYEVSAWRTFRFSPVGSNFGNKMI